MEKFIFDWNNDFYIGNANQYNWKQGLTYIIQFYNIVLEKLGATLGLEFHYELQIDDKNNKCIRFDCHARKYNFFVGLTGEEYSNEIGSRRVDIRNELRSKFKNAFTSNGIIYASNKPNFNYLIKKDISTCETMQDCLNQSKNFMKDTYDKIVEIIKSFIE